jgi:hypothetical protein
MNVGDSWQAMAAGTQLNRQGALERVKRGWSGMLRVSILAPPTISQASLSLSHSLSHSLSVFLSLSLSRARARSLSASLSLPLFVSLNIVCTALCYIHTHIRTHSMSAYKDTQRLHNTYIHI